MTSMTAYESWTADSWTAPTMLSLWTEPEPKQARVVRHVSQWVKAVDTTVIVLCPPVVSVCAIFAAMMWPGPVLADTIGHAATSVPLNAQLQDVAPAP
ncbi:hypothetical protein [Mycolicibacterium vinylchloridicum]|uniref:hypothetical protein n=1 Tax=Mycolicibacterium vinylchloridicum TaxID=2736928 RepID=UPI0015C6CF4D|nr:hypothetical protein [Mycolicibacterium vinylchloridicum]